LVVIRVLAFGPLIALFFSGLAAGWAVPRLQVGRKAFFAGMNDTGRQTSRAGWSLEPYWFLHQVPAPPA